MSRPRLTCFVASLPVVTALLIAHAGCSSFGDEPEDDPSSPSNQPGVDGGSESGAVDGAAPPEGGGELDAKGDGPTPGTGPCEPATCRRVFVTAARTAGMLGGILGADIKCQTAANDASLGGTYKAWVSTTAVQALSRFTQRKVEYRRIDGALVAKNIDELASKKTLLNPISLTENGMVLADDEPVWTGTLPAGTRSADTCAGWVDGSMAQVGHVGRADATNESWTDAPSLPCNTDAHLYCFGD